MAKKITVLIVDDSAFIRNLFVEMLAMLPDIEVLGTANDAIDARAKIKQLNPDVLTLDIEMPGMNGIEFLEKIMALRPMPVVMASTLTQAGAEITIKALEIGAVDYISKPTSHLRESFAHVRDELADKIRTAAQVKFTTRLRPTKTMLATNHAKLATTSIELIAMGSSTGGVETLRDIFSVLPDTLPPIVMTQHMPTPFTTHFSRRLDALSKVTVVEATQRLRLKSGHAYLAPGDQHLSIMRVGQELVCKLDQGHLVSGHRPSVDVLFHSVAKHIGKQTIGVILTGMGGDGAQGLLAMRQAGAFTVGENAASCIVYGMPRVAMENGAVCSELNLDQIPHALIERCVASQQGAHGG